MLRRSTAYIVAGLLSLAVLIGTADAQERLPASVQKRTEGQAQAAPAAPAGAGKKVDYQPNFPEPPSLGSIVGRLAFGTVFVAIMCGGTLWYARRWMVKHQGPLAANGKELRLIETTRIGGTCCVHLLQVGNQLVLAGTDRTGLHSLVPLHETFSTALEEQIAEPKSAVRPAVLQAFEATAASQRHQRPQLPLAAH